MSEILWLLLVLYVAGYILAFFTSALAMLPSVFTYDSVYRKNLRLILVKIPFGDRREEYSEPEVPSFLNALKEYGWCLGFLLFNSLLSWFQVGATLFAYVWLVISWLFSPPAVKMFRWQIKNIPFQRAEDFAAYSQAQGVTRLSERQLAKYLEELSRKSETLAREYATLVFGDNEEYVESYVNDAKRLTKETHDSVVIHPRFWAIPQSKASALFAVEHVWSSAGEP